MLKQNKAKGTLLKGMIKSNAVQTLFTTKVKTEIVKAKFKNA